MSTTVIASAYGPALYLAPWSSRNVDPAALERISKSHGIDLFDAAALSRTPEVIVAQGLGAKAAAALATDLREAGLIVRVVADPGIQRSARLGMAIAYLFLLALLTSPLLLPALWFLFNALYLSLRGTQLQLVGEPLDPNATSQHALEAIRALGDTLPDHILGPLLKRANALARQAQTEPEGQAAQALDQIAADLRREKDSDALRSADELRRDIARARQAAREIG